MEVSRISPSGLDLGSTRPAGDHCLKRSAAGWRLYTSGLRRLSPCWAVAVSAWACFVPVSQVVDNGDRMAPCT